MKCYLPPEKGEDRVRVCQKNICNIFRVTARHLQVLIEKLNSGQSVSDSRGLHTNRPRSTTDLTTEKYL